MPLDPVALQSPGALHEIDPNVTRRPALNFNKPGISRALLQEVAVDASEFQIELETTQIARTRDVLVKSGRSIIVPVISTSYVAKYGTATRSSNVKIL